MFFYRQIRNVEKIFSPKTKYIFYNAQLTFTMQIQMLMAPICPFDEAAIVAQKINLTARFIDLMINAKVTNYKRVERNNIESYIAGLTRDIRRLSIDELKTKLKKHFDALDYNVADAFNKLRLNQFTRKYIRNILARVTFERFTYDFADKNEFYYWCDSIGALLLLRKSINASLGDSNILKSSSNTVRRTEIFMRRHLESRRMKTIRASRNLLKIIIWRSSRLTSSARKKFNAGLRLSCN